MQAAVHTFPRSRVAQAPLWHVDALLAEPQNQDVSQPWGQVIPKAVTQQHALLSAVEGAAGRGGKEGWAGLQGLQSSEPLGSGFPTLCFGQVEDGGKTPAGLKPCQDGDAVTEHFATGSQGKIHPSPPEFGCSFFHLSFSLRKKPEWISLFPRLTSSCPKISQALLIAVASSRAVGDVGMSLLCVSLGKWSRIQRLPAKTGNKENRESCTRCNGETSREGDEN